MGIVDLISFTRASNATHSDEAGLIVTASTDVSRPDHDPVTFAQTGYLFEEQRTNICLQSEDVLTTWAQDRLTLTANDRVAPDGATTADLCVCTSANGVHLIRQVLSFTSGTVYTISTYCRAAGYNFVRLDLPTAQFAAQTNCLFDLSDGTLDNAGAGAEATRIIDAGGGWYRIEMSATCSSTGSGNAGVWIAETSTVSFTGDDASGAHLWGMQVEAGDFASSYIKTTSGTVTRSAEVCNITDLDWYRESEGTFIVELGPLSDALGTAERAILYLDSAVGGERWRVTVDFSNRLFFSITGASGTSDLTGDVITLTAASNKFAIRYKASDYALVVNGGTPTTDSHVDVPAPTYPSLTIGKHLSTSTTMLNGRIKRIRYIPRGLTNAEMQTETT